MSNETIDFEPFERVKTETEELAAGWLNIPREQRRDDWYEIEYLLRNIVACWNDISKKLKPKEEEKKPVQIPEEPEKERTEKKED